MSDHPLLTPFLRLSAAIERLAPPKSTPLQFEESDVFLWEPSGHAVQAVTQVNRLPLDLLKGIDRAKDTLLANTRQHAEGLAANNALLWGARGTGKSSLVKSVHAAINHALPKDRSLILVEIHREDIESLPVLLNALRSLDRRFLLFCDDLSFEAADDRYKALKAVLEGGVQGRPENVVFYATSNRRHLMARSMIENERQSGIHASEATEEKVSLSDRFGLWLGFHHVDQATYLEMIESYVARLALETPWDHIRAQALEWSTTRGDRSGRVAWQFIQDLAGREGKSVTGL